MYPLYSKRDFEAANSRDSLPLRCKECQNTFLTAKRIIVQIINGTRKKPGDFCSANCQRAFEDPPVMVACKQCETSFKKTQAEIAKSKSGNHFCLKRLYI